MSLDSNNARRLHGLGRLILAVALGVGASAEVPVKIEPLTAPHGMVVAGHPEAAQIGVDVLQAGGNAVDAAVAVSLALGVAEPYSSGLGGKLMLLYYDAATGKTHTVDAMDAAGSIDVAAWRQRPEGDRSYGYGSVCVPGLVAGLWMAHQQWGRRVWADNVAPAIRLARDGFEILPKTRGFFHEQEKKLRTGDAELARLYLPQGKLPEIGTRLANPDLAHTLGLLAAHGRDGFYRGPVAEVIAAASAQGGGSITLDDLMGYEAHLSEPIGLDFRGYRLLAAPPPATGAALFFTILKAIEVDVFDGPLRSAANLDKIGRVWREALPLVQGGIADAPGSLFNYERMVAPDSIRQIRARASVPLAKSPRVALLDGGGWPESAQAATTHFIVADAAGNIVCATQSYSLHFGAGVVPPGTGVVLNDSMSNFSFDDEKSLNYPAPGRRPRSTIAPALVLRAGRPLLAIGIPGGARIPTAMLQVLFDRLVCNRSLQDAIGDTRVHWVNATGDKPGYRVEAEETLPEATVVGLRALGWEVELREPAGTGVNFGGLNVITLNPDGTKTGYADPRRTNAAVGY